MKKTRLLSLFARITLISFVSIIVIFGTLDIMFLIDDNSSIEELIKQSTAAYEDGISKPLNSFDSIQDDVRFGSYDYLEDYLMTTKEFLLNSETTYTHTLESIELSGSEGCFMINNDGDITYDTTNKLSGNIYNIKDVDGNLVGELFSPKLTDDESYRFTSMFLTNGISNEYYSVIMRLDKENILGIMISSEEALDFYKDKNIELLEMIPSSNLASFDLLDFEGNVLAGDISLSMNQIKLMLESPDEELPMIEHPDYGVMYFKVYPELEWILINRSQYISSYQKSYDNLRRKGEIRLSIFLHAVFATIIIIFIVFSRMLKSVRFKIQAQMTALNKAADSEYNIGEDDIKFEEFRKIVHIFNRIKRHSVVTEPTDVDHSASNDYKSYFLSMIKRQLIDQLKDGVIEQFELNVLIEESLKKLYLENSDFDIEFIGDTDVMMTQNKTALSGFVQFCALNLLVNSKGSKVNLITVETIADHKNVYIKINKNIGKRDIKPTLEELDILESLAPIIELSLGGSLLLEHYSNEDRKIVLHLPILKQLTV